MKIFENIQNLSTLLEKLPPQITQERLKIISIQNFVKMPRDASFALIERLDDEIFENKDAQIKQTYSIALDSANLAHLAQNLRNLQNLANFSLSLQNNAQSLAITFPSGFEVPSEIKDFDLLFERVKIAQILQNVILRNLDAQKNLIYEKLKSVSSPLKSELKFTLAQSKNFIDSADGELAFEIKGVDLNKKNVISLNAGAKICVYKNPKNGIAGRNLKGEFIIPKAKNATLPPTFSEAIKMSENADIREFFTTQSGFVIFEKNHLFFSQELSLQNLVLKDNYNFLGDLNVPARVIVGTKDEFSDAVQNGVEIRANEIIINGSVGASVSLEASKIEISAQTHKDAILRCKSAKIATHKGILECESAEIDSLEGGKITAKKIRANKASSGEILANEAEIKEIFFGNAIRFCDKCSIEVLKGGDNKFIFTPLASAEIATKINALKNEMDENLAREASLKAKESALIYKYNKFHKTAQDLKAQIEANKAKNRTTPDYILKNYKAFLEIVNGLKALKSEIVALNKAQNLIIKSIRECQQCVFSAEFICKDGWLKYNDVIFELISPKLYQTTTIIKGVGKYHFDEQERRVIHQKIFSASDENINNQGF